MKLKWWKCTLCLVGIYIIWQAPGVYPPFSPACIWFLVFIRLWQHFLRKYGSLEASRAAQCDVEAWTLQCIALRGGLEVNNTGIFIDSAFLHEEGDVILRMFRLLILVYWTFDVKKHIGQIIIQSKSIFMS